MSHLCGVLVVPALSVSSPRLLAQLQSEDLTIKELADLLKLDPGLGARLLHVANSPFFGVSRQISSVGEAVIVLGLNQTRSLVQVEMVRSVVAEYPWKLLSLRDYWQRSLSMAAACQLLAGEIAYSQSTAFSTGLFHNLGELVMLQQYTQQYGDLMQVGARGQALADQENALFHTDHGQMGAEVLRSWNLPAEICNALSKQYSAIPPSHRDLLHLVLSTAHVLVQAPDSDVILNTLVPERMSFFGLSKATLPGLMQTLNKKIKQWTDLAGAI